MFWWLEIQTRFLWKAGQATINDILPTERMTNEWWMRLQPLLPDAVAYTPGNEKWKDRKEMEESVKAMIREDRPLPPKKMDACPFGVFNVDKGTKKGNTDVQAMQERLTMMRSDGQQRSNSMKEIGWPQTTLEQLNVTKQMILTQWSSWTMYRSWVPSGICSQCNTCWCGTPCNAILDPTGLTAHKGMLHRIWNVNKPNYAEAKSLIRIPSLCVFYTVLCVFEFVYHIPASKYVENRVLKASLVVWPSEMGTHYRWHQNAGHRDCYQISRTTAAEEAQEKHSDDVLAHCIYFIQDALVFCEFEDAVSHADQEGYSECWSIGLWPSMGRTAQLCPRMCRSIDQVEVWADRCIAACFRESLVL